MNMLMMILLLLLMAAALAGGGYFCILALHPAQEENSGLESLRSMQRYFQKLDNRHRVRNLLAVRVISQTEPGRRRDRLDREVTEILMNRFPEGAICREDAASWLILLEGSDCMERVREQAATLESDLGGHPDFRRIYFGAYYRIASSISFEEAVLRAQRACSEAQIQLSSPICEWDYRMYQDEKQQAHLAQDIHNQIAQDRVFLEFQPMVDADDGRVLGGEVLARLNSDRDGILSPGTFLPVVETVGEEEAFDYYVFEKCCRWISGLNSEARKNRFLSFNFTQSTLCREDFPRRLLELADRYRIPGSCLAVESDRFPEGSAAQSNLRQLKNAGLHIFFKEPHPESPEGGCADGVKIRADQLGEQADRLARKLTAEGSALICCNVETGEQAEKARRTGCSVLQGYYFYRPMPVSEFEKLITEEKT